jgi:hypothetical protein
MAGDWLKFEKATPDKPEVFAIAARLNLDPDAVVGKLIRVWSWFDTHTVDGNGRSVTPSLLDRISGVTGFVMAMASVGWLVVSDDGVSLPNFDRHTGETAKGRALTAKRVAGHKERSNAKGNGDGVTSALPREEKRREEEKQKKPAARTSPKIDLQAFLAECEAAGEEAIPADDAVFAYAERIRLPREFVALAWGWFKVRYAGKRQAGVRGWRQTFRNAIEGNWPKLWYADGDSWALTTAGKQAQRAAQ